MIFKSYLLEQNLQSINKEKILLFYGENQGLKKEFKDKIRLTNNKIKILSLFQEDIIKNKDILFNEIKNGSLFDENKIIFINEVNDKILETIEDIVEHIKEEKIFIFSDLLDKKSKLRNYFEKSKDCGVVACYQDNEITIRKIISSKLNSFKGVTSQAINIIIKNIGLDRNKINNEINKIESCFKDKVINLEKLEELLNIKSNDDFNLLKDEALKGNKINTNKLLADTVFEVENNSFYLHMINQRINKLNQIDQLKNEGVIADEAVAVIKPPVFWKDKPILIEQSKKWDKEKIIQALKKTYQTEIIIKSNSTIRKDLLIKNLIVELCLTANAS